MTVSAEEFLIPREVREAQQRREAGEPAEPVKQPDRYIGVLEENWTAVAVFQLCLFEEQTVVGATKAVSIAIGIRTAEVLAVCELLDLSKDERSDVLAKVRLMSNTAVRYLNNRD